MPSVTQYVWHFYPSVFYTFFVQLPFFVIIIADLKIIQYRKIDLKTVRLIQFVIQIFKNASESPLGDLGAIVGPSKQALPNRIDR
jgi:hypothetical protein